MSIDSGRPLSVSFGHESISNSQFHIKTSQREAPPESHSHETTPFLEKVWTRTKQIALKTRHLLFLTNFTPSPVKIAPPVEPLFAGAVLRQTTETCRKHEEEEAWIAETLRHEKISLEEIGEIHKQRIEEIQNSSELRDLFGIDLAAPTVAVNEMRCHLLWLSEASKVEKKLALAFLDSIGNEKMDTSTLVSLYANHTIALSIQARGALIEQIKQKNNCDTSIFRLMNDISKARLGTALTSAAVWLTLNSLTWMAIVIPLGVVYGCGIAMSVLSFGVTAVAMTVMAKRKPCSFCTFMEGAFFGRSGARLLKNVLLHGLFYKKRIAAMEKALTNPHLSEEKRIQLCTKIERMKKNLTSVDNCQAKYQEKILSAAVLDYQTPHKYDQLYGSDPFMEEIIEIAVAEMERSNDIFVEELERAFKVIGIETEGLRSLPQEERREAIKMGLELFIGRPPNEVAHLNEKQRRHHKAHNVAAIEQLIGKDKEGLADLLSAYGLELHMKDELLVNEKGKHKLAKHICRKIDKSYAVQTAAEIHAQIAKMAS